MRIIFIESLEAPDEGIEGFWVVFRDIKFNAGSIESEDVCKGRVNGLTDGFGEIHHALEHHFNIRKEVLFKACEERGIRDFGKAAEIPKFLTEGKEEDKKGIRGNGEDLLQDKSREESSERIDTFPAEGLIKSVIKSWRNELGNVKVFFKKAEKGRGIVKKDILTIRKGFF